MGRKKKGNRGAQVDGASSSDKPDQPEQAQATPQAETQTPQERGGQGDGPSGLQLKVEHEPQKEEGEEWQTQQGSQQQKAGKRGKRGKQQQSQDDQKKSQQGQGDQAASQVLSQQKEQSRPQPQARQMQQQSQYQSQAQQASPRQGQQQFPQLQTPQSPPTQSQPPQASAWSSQRQPAWRQQAQQQPQRQQQQPQHQQAQRPQHLPLQQQSQPAQQQQQRQQQFPQGQQGKGRRQQEAPRSTSESHQSSPYSVTPSSSTSSITQGPRESSKQGGGDMVSAMQGVSIASAQVSAGPSKGGGDATSSQLLPQISPIERKGGTACRQKITVITNHFPLNIGKLQKAIHYDVAIVPDRPKKLFRTVMEEFRKRRYQTRWPAYDGNKNLYSSSALFESTEISDTISVMEDDKAKEYQVTVKFATYVDLTCLQNYSQRVRGKSILEMEKPMQALQCLDIVLRSAPALSCIPVGRSYFTRPRQPYVLGDGCVLYHGFYQAAILGWKPYVNIDVAHKAFPTSLNMIDLVREICPRADINQELQRFEIDSLNKHMKQLKVQYEIPKNPASRRVYRVNQLDASPKKATFKDDSGNSMTVERYFTQVKKITLRYPNLPTLWVGSRSRDNKILLPFELCLVLPDQAVNKKMTEQQTRNMIRQAATNTTIRKENIQRAIQSANYNGSNTMREFGISVNPTPQEVEARVLSPPYLQYLRKPEKVSKGTWRAGQFRVSISLTNWSILCLDPRTRDDQLQHLALELANSCKSFGMTISRPAPLTRLTDRNLSTDLKRYFGDNKHYQMVVVILSHRNESYNYVKQASEIAVGCLTQCLKPNTVQKLSKSTVDNILLKINAKLNGLNHGLTELPMCLQRPCMIMGADVTHPGPDSKDFPSVAAVTASVDVTAFKYRFEWRLQQSRQEMIEDLEEITRQHLLNFYRSNNNAKPEKILYVRDGVSDGQFTQVLNVELMAIRAACQRLEQNYKPPIIFIVVQKRHHTRFFPKDPGVSEDRNLNVPAGTCVDTEITHPTIVDFYLVSHASIQGVAKPTKYVKLWDDCKMSEDELEKLMYYLCHMFARCNRSVSYPAPTYYAHLAAARARVYCEIERIDMSNLQGEQKRLTIKENIAKGLPMFFV